MYRGAVTPLLHCYTIVSLLLHFRYTVVTLLAHSCDTSVGANIELMPKAKEQIARLERQGFGGAHTHTHTHSHTHTQCIQICKHTQTHTYIHADTHTCTHTPTPTRTRTHRSADLHGQDAVLLLRRRRAQERPRRIHHPHPVAPSPLLSNTILFCKTKAITVTL
jgi:hypothetical protein